MAALAGVAWLPWLLFALPGGVLVDRVDRRRLMVTIDWIRVAAMGLLATALLAGRVVPRDALKQTSAQSMNMHHHGDGNGTSAWIASAR